MLRETEVTGTFPSTRIPSQSGGLDVEVSLIAQLGHGAGDQLFSSVSSRQRRHGLFIDELDEPSAKLGATDFARNNATALYSFAVGPKGHPFHRHAGHRVFTAVSGSGGAQLRFSSVSDADIAAEPQNFIRALRFVNIPPDCLFTVRFGGETWHQFAPLKKNSLHPVFFALSTHTNELGGTLAQDLKQKILANAADIPALTEVLPDSVAALLNTRNPALLGVPATTLSLDAPDGTLHRIACDIFRGGAGFARGTWAAWRDASGFLTRSGPMRAVKELPAPPAASLLLRQLPALEIHHDDTFCLAVSGVNLKGARASQLLALVLEGFLLDAPSGVSSLMALRNMMVKPLGLRTSKLGCPVSSLLSPKTNNLFANEYPVLDQHINEGDTKAEVILGADDKHLSFRSCVAVEITGEGQAEVTLGPRVHCRNGFGRFYMSAIDAVHRRYISPTMLRRAVDYAIIRPALAATQYP